MLDDESTLARDIIRVFILEHWARFYYAKDKDGQTVLSIPADVIEKIRESHTELVPMLEETNATVITYEESCKNVGAFVCRLLDGPKYAPGVVTKAMDSKPFKIEMHLLSLWLKGHESYLDAHDLSYDDWLEMFVNWKQMDQVKAFIEKLQSTPPASEKTSQSVH